MKEEEYRVSILFTFWSRQGRYICTVYQGISTWNYKHFRCSIVRQTNFQLIRKELSSILVKWCQWKRMALSVWTFA